MTAAFTPFETEVRGGRRVSIREVEPGDAAAFAAAFSRLSAEARYNRFMTAMRDPAPAFVQHAVNPVAGRELALVAVAAVGAESRIVALARYIVAAGGTCEFALTVADEWQRAGLGSVMLEALMRTARAHGLTHMEGYVLASNAPMLDLARHLGFTVGPSDEGPAVKCVSATLSG